MSREVPVWSPDGRWIAAVCYRQPGAHLIVIAADGSVIHEILDLPEAWAGLGGWLDGTPRYLASLRIVADSIFLAVGSGLRITADGRDPLGRALHPPLRWSVRDTTVARVDSLGFVRGRRPGTTTLIVTAGGIRTDSAAIRVHAARVDTLLHDDWSRGLDTTRWRPFGWPLPQVVPRAGVGGASAFMSNGASPGRAACCRGRTSRCKVD